MMVAIVVESMMGRDSTPVGREGAAGAWLIRLLLLLFPPIVSGM